MTKFELVVAQLRAEKQNFDDMVYVTGYENLEEYANERKLSVEDAFEDIIERVETIEKPTREQLAEPFILIDQPTSSMFEIITSEEINANQNVIVYYQPNDHEIEFLGEIMTNQSLSVEDALELIDADVEDYDYNAIKLAY